MRWCWARSRPRWARDVGGVGVRFGGPAFSVSVNRADDAVFAGAGGGRGGCLGRCRAWLYFGEARAVAAIVLIVWGTVVATFADYVVKPFVLHGHSNLHPLLALLSVLGGWNARADRHFRRSDGCRVPASLAQHSPRRIGKYGTPPTGADQARSGRVTGRPCASRSAGSVDSFRVLRRSPGADQAANLALHSRPVER